jgi:aminotransferase
MPSTIDLSGDRLEVASPPHVREAAKTALDQGETHYTTRPGLIPLRQVLASRHADRTGTKVNPLRQVLVTCGEEEALFVAIHTLVAPGDEVLVIGPSPATDAAVIVRAGSTARHLEWPTADSEPSSWLRGSMSERTRVVLVRNPSLGGEVLEDPVAPALFSEAAAHNATVVVLESLADFGREGRRLPGLLSIPGADLRTLTIGGFSAWGLDGWRVGYMIGPEALILPMTNLKQALSICSPALGQFAALAAVTGSQRHLDHLRADLDDRWDAMVSELDKSGVPVTVPVAGYHLFVRAAGLGSELSTSIWDAVSVRVASGEGSGAAETIRITLSQPAPILVDAARRIAPLLAGVRGGHRGA